MKLKKDRPEAMSRAYERVVIQGRPIWLPPPVEIPETVFVGREDILRKALACWQPMREDKNPPSNFRLSGPPGMGKNAIFYELLRRLGTEGYRMYGRENMTSEDLACKPVELESGKIEYNASALFAAMYRGKPFLFDEIGQAPGGTLISLVSVLDHEQRVLVSEDAGVEIKAREGFRFCAALNTDEEEAGALPEKIDDRLRPVWHIGYPILKELEMILAANLHFEDHLWLKVFVSEFKDKQLSTRNALEIMNYACRLYEYDRNNGRGADLTEAEISNYLAISCRENIREPQSLNELTVKPEEKNREEEDEVLFNGLFKKNKKPDIH